MQIVLFLIFILLVILIFTLKSDELSSKTKVAMAVSILIIIALASFYEFSKNSNDESNRAKVNAFLQGKTLTCKKDIEVSSESFEYFSGTQTFAPREANTKYKGLIIEVSECEIKK